MNSRNISFRFCGVALAHAAILVCLLFLWPMLGLTQETNSSGRPELQSFRIITQRNIFNGNRSPRRERTRSEAEPERRVRVDSIALLGTMNYEKGWVAFFGGSSPEYRKALQAGDTIAAHKIAEIAANYVKLESGSNQPIDLRVGTEMKKRDEGAWEVKDRIETSVAASASPSPSTDTNASNASDGESDIIKRLMQQREQELQK